MFWWRLRQWVYARPPVAAAGAVLLLALVGVGGWESARRLSDAGAGQEIVETARHQVAGAQIIRVQADVGQSVRVVRRTRTVSAPGRTNTVVVTRSITQVVPTVVVRNHGKTVTAERTRTVVARRITTRTVGETQTIRETVTAAAQGGGPPQTPPGQVGRSRSTQTVTVTQTRTVMQPAVTVTVTVTTSKGH
jgi:hypothetical protein